VTSDFFAAEFKKSGGFLPKEQALLFAVLLPGRKVKSRSPHFILVTSVTLDSYLYLVSRPPGPVPRRTRRHRLRSAYPAALFRVLSMTSDSTPSFFFHLFTRFSPLTGGHHLTFPSSHNDTQFWLVFRPDPEVVPVVPASPLPQYFRSPVCSPPFGSRPDVTVTSFLISDPSSPLPLFLLGASFPFCYGTYKVVNPQAQGRLDLPCALAAVSRRVTVFSPLHRPFLAFFFPRAEH